jgi:hypothetical protein
VNHITLENGIKNGNKVRRSQASSADRYPGTRIRNMSRGSRNMNTGKATAATTDISRDLPWLVVVVVARRLSETVNCVECF